MPTPCFQTTMRVHGGSAYPGHGGIVRSNVAPKDHRQSNSSRIRAAEFSHPRGVNSGRAISERQSWEAPSSDGLWRALAERKPPKRPAGAAAWCAAR